MVNSVTLIGNLGNSVDVHYFEGGGCVGKFSLATSRVWKDKNTGEKKEKTTWHNIITRNKTAENCAKYLSKGDKVFVSGEIDNRSWEQNGEKRYITEIVAFDIKFLTQKSQSSQDSNSQPATAATRSTGGHAGDDSGGGSGYGDQDDLPF